MRLMLSVLSVCLVMSIHADELARVPVIVELFTSEGCSSCPPADALLMQLSQKQEVDGAQVIALGFHVDYWDDLGWKDRFSSPLFTQRQKAYRDAMHLRSCYTPQMVVNGTEEFLGSDQNAARTAIRDAAKVPMFPLTIQVKIKGDAIDITITQSTANTGDVYLALTESQLVSEVKNGENAGRKLPHSPVVRELRKVGDASKLQTTASLAISKDWKSENLKIVAFIQKPESMQIIGVGTAAVK